MRAKQPIDQYSPDDRWRDYAKVDRARAREIGQVVYWAGEPCKNGHNTWRNTSNTTCVLCNRRRCTERRQRLLGGAYGVAADHAAKLKEDRELARATREVWED